VQNPASLALAKVMEEGGTVPEELLNHYTVIQAGAGPGNYTQAGAPGLGAAGGWAAGLMDCLCCCSEAAGLVVGGRAC
jgi:hypothetical protein